MKFLITCIAAAFSLSPVSAQSAPDYKADLEIEEDKGMMDITAVFINNTSREMKLRYRLKVERKGAAGTSSNNQGGSFTAEANGKSKVSSSSVSVEEGDVYTLHLKIMDAEENVIAEKIITEKDQ